MNHSESSTAQEARPAPKRGGPSAQVARDEAAAFDRIVEKQGDFNPFQDRGWETLARRFREMAHPRTIGQSRPQGNACDGRDAAASGGRTLEMLDVGCGTGQSRRIYDGSYRRYVGIDLSEGSLRLARGSRPQGAGVSWVRADACVLPFADESLDVVAFSSVLHHIPAFELALNEAWRVLRPGGCVFAYDPNLLNPPMAVFRHPNSPLYTAEGVSPHERPLLPRVLRTAFEAAGLHDVRQRCQSDIPYRHVAPRLMNACLSVYNWCDWILELTGLGRVFGTFVLTVGYKPAAGNER